MVARIPSVCVSVCVFILGKASKIILCKDLFLGGNVIKNISNIKGMGERRVIKKKTVCSVFAPFHVFIHFLICWNIKHNNITQCTVIKM